MLQRWLGWICGRNVYSKLSTEKIRWVDFVYVFKGQLLRHISLIILFIYSFSDYILLANCSEVCLLTSRDDAGCVYPSTCGFVSA